MDLALSYNYFKTEVQQWIFNNFDPSSKILDVGPGAGTYYNLLHDKYKYIDGVEIYYPNIVDHKLAIKYTNIYNEDIKNFKYGYNYYDLIIFGDVLEHMTIEDAQYVLNYAIPRCKNFIVAVPYCYKQKANENKWEEHIQDDLTIENVKERYPMLKLLYGDNYYGYYIKDEKY